MPKSAPLTKTDGEVRELKAEDLKRFRGASSLSSELQRKLGVRGPQKTPTKERITIRLSRDVVERFRATGDGWQSRVDGALVLLEPVLARSAVRPNPSLEPTRSPTLRSSSDPQGLAALRSPSSCSLRAASLCGPLGPKGWAAHSLRGWASSKVRLR